MLYWQLYRNFQTQNGYIKTYEFCDLIISCQQFSMSWEKRKTLKKKGNTSFSRNSFEYAVCILLGRICIFQLKALNHWSFIRDFTQGLVCSFLMRYNWQLSWKVGLICLTSYKSYFILEHPYIQITESVSVLFFPLIHVQLPLDECCAHI